MCAADADTNYSSTLDDDTPRERLELDGNLEAELAEEESRRKIMYWDEYVESTRRGEGNTMNRG